MCDEALGMQNGKIPDSAISASTEYGSSYKAIHGRLHLLVASGRVGAWAARTNDVHQFLQVNFGDWKKVTRVTIQGRQDADQWVKSFSLSYGYDPVFFQSYKENGTKIVSYWKRWLVLMQFSLPVFPYSNQHKNRNRLSGWSDNRP